MTKQEIIETTVSRVSEIVANMTAVKLNGADYCFESGAFCDFVRNHIGSISFDLTWENDEDVIIYQADEDAMFAAVRKEASRAA